MRMTHEQYWASRDGKRLRVNFIPELKEGILQVYKDAGYVIVQETVTWDTEGMGVE